MQCPCRKRMRRASYLLTVDINLGYRERQQIFPSEDCGCSFVCPGVAGLRKVQQPQGKTHHPNVSQCRLGLDAAQGFSKNLEHPLMRRWHFSHCSSAACLEMLLGGGGFFICGDVIEEEDHDFYSLCQIAIKIWRLKCKNKKVCNI